ncbi:glutamate racemase [Helicobacter enhydrae]|uniref:Glutamate racemase n=1 Tax=Helicobacter enhydrae TaxID=222136 RepID=A0A1B1U3W7_9HELI|nr:glutamate racemase [Helicobacter enhydrae]ANV97453.1 glutamate racemase [Helicobacter enhydrae]
MRAGVFDSGIGGVSVLKSLLDARLFEEIVYYGDTARVPYGTKDKETIIQYSLEALEFFKSQNIDILILACNTVSAYALDILKQRVSFPIIGVIEAGVLALQNTAMDKNAQILVIATQATTQSQIYPNALHKLGYKHITALATSLFVPFVEEGIYDGEFLQECLKHYFSKLQTTPQFIILGCTHYPFIAKAISQYFNHQCTLIHSGNAIVEQLKKECALTPTFANTTLKFFSSQNNQTLEKEAYRLLKRQD